MITRVIVTLQVEGFHSWPDAGHHPESYLFHKHRHVFHIRLAKRVMHDDRDVEIIRLKRDVLEHIAAEYGTPANFVHMSCEHIAKRLLLEFCADSVTVLEDGENGAEVSR